MKEKAFRFIVTAVTERLAGGEVSAVDGWHAGCGELAWGGCLCAWNFGVTRSPVFTGAEGTIRPNMTL